MAAKTVSQKKFAKLVASTGVLSQPPGALTRMSNLLFNQRGSLQIADGSLSVAIIPGGFPTLVLASFTKLLSGQFPYYSALALNPAPQLTGSVGNFAFGAVSGVASNPAGMYSFGIVAIVAGGGHTDIGPTILNPNIFVGFNSITFSWIAVPGATGYIIYNLASPFPHSSAVAIATVGAVTTTTVVGAFPASPVIQTPYGNTSYVVQLFSGAVPIGGSLTFTAVAAGVFPGSLPLPASLAPGSPGFDSSTALAGFSPYGGLPGAICPIPQIVQFAGEAILILGNGYAPQATDPSLGASAPVTPLANTFQDAFPDWQASVTWLTGSQVTDGAGNYYTATQGGVSGATVPTPWNTALGAQTADGTVLWTSQGPIVASTAPRGAAHAVAYAGSLWLANTSPADTSDGIDGPSCLKMSDSNNPNSWNPVNTAFVGRQDGSQITGLCPFTIAALGISPTGSLCIFKEFTTYQFIGVFGTTSFEIQPAQTNLGCIAARSIQFLPGFGVVRFTHLGFAVFDGINDRLISEDIRPYLFGGVDSEADLTPVDPTYCYLSQSAQTVAPPMYLCATPLLGAAGALTRLFCYDLVMKSWAVLDLPWAITSMATVAGGEGYPLVLAGKTDGTIQRLQAGDLNWDQGDTAQSAVQWSFRTPELFGEGGTQRLFYEKVTITGYGSPAMVQSIIANLWLDGQQIGAQGIDVVPMGGSNLFTASVSIFRNGNRAHLDISGNSGGATGVIDSVDWAVTAKSSMARRIIS
jgi:hypothetical protein